MNTEHTNQPVQAEPASHSPIDLQSIPERQRGFTAENIRDIAHECMRIGDNEQAEVVFAIADALRDGNLIIQSPAQQQAEPAARDVLAAFGSEVKRACVKAWGAADESHEGKAIEECDITAIVDRYAAQPPAVATVPQEAADSIRSPFNACCNKEHCRAMLAAAPQAADPIKRLIAMHNELLGEYPYCYFELAYTRRTDWMAWLCTKPREDDPERKVLACGQGLTAEEACAEAISAAQKGGEAC